MLYNFNYSLTGSTVDCLGIPVDENGSLLYDLEKFLDSYSKKECNKLRTLLSAMKKDKILKQGICFTFPFIKDRLFIMPVKGADDKDGFLKCKHFLENNAEVLCIDSLKIDKSFSNNL